ncbi:hypothetical protein CRE_11438 [Caenorhabditis remanei]|uniref:DUF38 domain-containing protein n=1 Tax=Caenorhabditis remanei TaxID=31234 RepID=E3NBH0_CAERE|nr:hypothetical protein CRE_11438 [Caenorhabditis remanei]
MDQWKQAKHVKITDINDLPIEHFFHFSTFEVNFESISTNDLVRLCDNLFKSINFVSCTIETEHLLDNEEIKNALNLRPSDTANKYYIPNSNLEVQFSVGYDAKEISIRKV